MNTPESSGPTEADPLQVEPERGENSAEVAPVQGLNVMAVVSLILALVASPFTIIFGYIAVGQSRRARQRGEGIAWVAIGLGWFWLVAWVVLGITLGTIWFEL
jgi:uncharacterized membrane protein